MWIANSPIIKTMTLLTTVATLSVACGEGDESATAPPSSTTTTTTTTSTTQAPPAALPPIPDSELPGDDFTRAPAAGRSIAVIGVRFNDVLDVRLTPDGEADIGAGLAPNSNDAVATGRARANSSAIWWEVTMLDGSIGWIGSSLTAQLGPTTDLTSQVVADLGSIPEAAGIAELGLIVAESFDNDPDIPTEIVETVQADESGDLAEVTFDVVGFGDDAVRGVRLHVFGQPLENGSGFGLKSVEATELCDPTRGPATPGDLCA